MSFPPEIIDHIFTFLQSDPTTLAQCSRAHPILSPLADRLLYASILLSDSGTDTDLCPVLLPTELHYLLTASPHIANHVRNLEIRPSEDLLRADPIGLILPKLLQLSSISLTSSSYSSTGCWTNLPSGFRDAFTNRLSSSDSLLKEVSISSYSHFPLDAFDGCKTLKSITLYGCTNYPDSDLRTIIYPILDSISLFNWQTTDWGFLAWTQKRIHRLRSLLLHSIYRCVINGLLPELVRTCSNSLTSLDLHIYREFRTEFGPNGTIVSPGRQISLDLSSVPSLKSLTIGAHLYVQNTQFLEGYYCAFPAIIELLQTTSYLDNLILKFRIYCTSLEPNYDLIDWSPLLSFISSSLANFRHIELRFSLLTYTRYAVVSARTLPRLYYSEICSNMMAKGILDISTDDRQEIYQMW